MKVKRPDTRILTKALINAVLEENISPKVFDELKEVTKRRYVGTSNVAGIYALLGQTEAALQWLERAYSDGGNRFENDHFNSGDKVFLSVSNLLLTDIPVASSWSGVSVHLASLP